MTEQQPYEVLRRFPLFEARRYPAHLVAEVEVEASFTRAGNEAFGVLVAFISGRNSTRGKVTMTAPVLQEQAPTKIAMTSPVVQQPGAESGRHVVAFVMPAEFTLDTLPTPSDPRIQVRQVPAQVAAVKPFTGRWTEHIYQQQLAALRGAVEQAGLEVSGPPRFARFDPPWTPWFLRRNEVVLPIAFSPGL
ncbi:SOUL family heme-binding protein [Tessaracoccus sp. Y36]|uniref:SOUL family heme-binding protein n=1 Tax=Tessaracoccus sp. ZS01 TaxID=1906324 RepID=UPI00096C5FB3|nr:heme-binding protein [Tessaracoccus sp. ZS01]MCG6568452.1 heme-binding protein [Tessaracoccus sp. ZS01]OMG52739.1 heme-binding protein [Tessaracoccus sp. ZS01]